MIAAPWTTKRLGEVADLLGGGTPPRSERELFGADIDWVTPSDLPPIGEVRSLGVVAERLSWKGLESSSAKQLPPGTVLYSSRASIGKIAVADRPCCTNQGFINFIPDASKLDPWYLAYYLASKTPEIEALAGTTTFKEVSRGKLRDFPISYPALPVQRQLVATAQVRLARVHEVRTLRAEAAKEADALLCALIEEQLANTGLAVDRVPLASVCSIQGRLVDPREAEYRELLHIGGANIQRGTGELAGLQTAAEEKLTSGKFLFCESDVLYNKIRPYLRKVARPNFRGLCSADVYPLRPREGVIDRAYLFYLLLSRSFTDYAVRVSNRAGMPKVNRVDLFAYQCALPSPENQRAIASRLDEARAACLSVRNGLKAHLQEGQIMEQAVLRRAFAGDR